MSPRTLRGLFWGAVFAMASTPSGGTGIPVPAGPQFQVNTYTSNGQSGPAVATEANGDFVVVWQSSGSSGGDTDNFSIQGQRYDSAGSLVGSQFQVNSYTTNAQMSPSVATDADGDFVVVWHSLGSSSETSGFSVQGQRYSSSGGALGSQFQVNTYTTNSQESPSVALDADGDFVVVWESRQSPSDDPSYSIRGQRYASSGSAIGSNFLINTYTTNVQQVPSVATDADGDFVVVWTSVGSSGSDTSGKSVQGQRYDSAGGAVGSQFQVNTYTTSDQEIVHAAARPNGDFVVAWRSSGSSGGDSSGRSVQGQRYDSAGGAVGSQFQVNTYTTSDQQNPSVATEDDDDFVVVWTSEGSAGSDTSGYSIQGQRYDSAGSPVGSNFQINTYTTNGQLEASISPQVDGDFIVVWRSNGSSGGDTSSFSVQGQRFTTCPRTIDLTAGTSGSLVPSSSFNETRGIDVTVGPSSLPLVAMTLDGLNISTASATVGARIYDSDGLGLIASAQTTVSTGTNLSVTIPISATLPANNDYRLAFFVDAGGGGTATLFDPDPAGGGGFPYTEQTGALEINQAYSIGSDSFPTGSDLAAPRIRIDVSCSAAIPVPALGYQSLALLAALLLASACIGHSRGRDAS